MKEFIFGLFPGTILFYRYSRTFFSGATLGIILMEIVPYLIISALEDLDLAMVGFGFLFLYSFYELGYLQNDRKAKEEKIGASIRSQFNSFRYKQFTVGRMVAILTLISYWNFNVQNISLYGAFLLVIIIPVFLFHNYTSDGVTRVFTFVLLNCLKIAGRILLLGPGLQIYFISVIPHLFVKLIHYLGSKRLLFIENFHFIRVSLCIYLSFIIIIMILKPFAVLVVLPYLINHNKKIIYIYFKRWLIK
jgi:hypothetical protein